MDSSIRLWLRPFVQTQEQISTASQSIMRKGEWTAGTVLKGTVVHALSSDTYLVNVEGRLITAKAEMLLSQGQNIAMELAGKHEGQLLARLVGEDGGENQAAIRILNSLNLPVNEQTKLSLKALAMFHMELSANNFQEMTKGMSSLGVNREAAYVTALAIKIGLPIEQPILQLLDKALFEGNPLKGMLGWTRQLNNLLSDAISRQPVESAADNPRAVGGEKPVEGIVKEMQGNSSAAKQDLSVKTVEPMVTAEKYAGINLPISAKDSTGEKAISLQQFALKLEKSLAELIIRPLESDTAKTLEQVFKLQLPALAASIKEGAEFQNSFLRMLAEVAFKDEAISKIETTGWKNTETNLSAIGTETKAGKGSLHVSMDILIQQEELADLFSRLVKETKSLYAHSQESAFGKLLGEARSIEQSLMGSQLMQQADKGSLPGGDYLFFHLPVLKTDGEEGWGQLKVFKDGKKDQVDMGNARVILVLDTVNLGMVTVELNVQKPQIAANFILEQDDLIALGKQSNAGLVAGLARLGFDLKKVSWQTGIPEPFVKHPVPNSPPEELRNLDIKI